MPNPRSFRDGEPRSSSRSDSVRDWLTVLLPPLTVVGMVAIVWMIFQAALTPAPLPVPAVASLSAPSSPEPGPTFPPEMVSAAVAISTFLAPTMEPTPSPTSAPVPAATEALICGEGVAIGTSCMWDDYTPTPEPTLGPCLTPIPASTCIWMGDISSTPVATGSGVRGT